MARKLKSPTRTISNRGDLPRFIGQYPCSKGNTSCLPFDSISSLYCGVYLEWRKDVVSIAFEPRVHSFAASGELPEVTCIPDYETTMSTGELALFEAKYSEDSLKDDERERLRNAAAHSRAAGMEYQIVFRKELEKSGFIDTVILLRRYGLLDFSAEVVAEAQHRLENFCEAHLEQWRERAARARIPTSLVYYLLYHQQLPLIYRPLQVMELQPCRA